MIGYWNGEPTEVRRVVVKVGTVPSEKWWCYKHQGTEYPAVEVTYNGSVFYIANDTGHGWAKVTNGRGSMHWGHRSLPDDSEVVRVLDDDDGAEL